MVTMQVTQHRLYAMVQGREDLHQFARRLRLFTLSRFLSLFAGRCVLGSPVGLASQVYDAESNSNYGRESGLS